MSKKPLTPEQQYMIEQVAATMGIEDMHLTEQCYENLELMAAGKKTKKEIINDITRRYSNV